MDRASEVSIGTIAAKQHLREEGWCVIPEVLTKERTRELLARLWEAKEASERQGDPTRLDFLDPKHLEMARYSRNS